MAEESKSSFKPIEEDVDTERAFMGADLSKVDTSDLLKMLEGLRARRGERPKSVRRGVKREKNAAMVAKFMQIVPEEMKPVLEQLSDSEKLKVLRKIVETRVKNKD